MIRRLFVIQMPHTSNKRVMPLLFRPTDCFRLRFC